MVNAGAEPNQIAMIEELSLNALPALHTALFDGWVVRFAQGYTRRANSVNPLYPGAFDLTDKIMQAEMLYRQRHLPTVFKLTPQSIPSELDDRLHRRSYREESGASVQVLDGLPTSQSARVSLSSTLTETWLKAYFRLNSTPIRFYAVMKTMLANIVPTRAFAALIHEQEIVAVGLGVLERGYVGLFDIVTAPALRRQGLGEELVLALLDWGRRGGASQSYLQVVPTNTPALRLYAKLGFSEAYQYWYRVRA